MDKHNRLFVDCLYREVGSMLMLAQDREKEESKELCELISAYGGVRKIRKMLPSAPGCWSEMAAGLEEIRSRLVTLSENRLYTY